jgi:hypothetical protein
MRGLKRTPTMVLIHLIGLAVLLLGLAGCSPT